PIVGGCVIAQNHAAFGGGVANEVGASPSYTNITLTGNTANIAPGGCNFQASCTIANSIIWGQTQNITNLTGGSATARYSLIGGSYPGIGNINLNPVFETDAGAVQFYRLAAGSPGIDRGENASAPTDFLDLDKDLDESEAAYADLLGGERFVDDPATVDMGSGTAPIVDMGASEYFIASPGCNEADLDEPYGTLDFSDVIAFLTAFGTMSDEADLVAPFGQWDFSDVIAFLTAFGGGCP
ncbi:MAG: GC-type dockerin domain-anchored protein, partial [Phycisphaerales bacterium]